MLRSVRFGMLATTMLASLAVGAFAQGLVTADHVGKPDAPNTLTLRLNPSQSPNAAQGDRREVCRRLGEMGRGASGLAGSIRVLRR